MKISVVIPTRNRPQELESCLRSFRLQMLENFEVIVFDNSDAHLKPLTRSVVDNCEVKQARYHSSDQALAMTNSWEKALSLTTGSHVTIIGDDDTVMPYGLDLLTQLASRHPEHVINWQPPWYYWPNCPNPNLANTFRLPAAGHPLALCKSQAQMNKVLSYEDEFTSLPTIYTSLIPRKIYQTAINHLGRFFHTRSPDVGTAFLLGALTDHYLKSPLPFFIAGISGKSNGAASMAANLDPSKDEAKIPEQVADFMKLSKESNLDYHPFFAGMPAVYAIEVASSALTIKDLLQSSGVRCNDINIDLKAAIRRGCHQVNQLPEENRQTAWDLMLQWAKSQDVSMQQACKASVLDARHSSSVKNAGQNKARFSHGWLPEYGRFAGRLTEDKVSNVEDFAEYASTLFCYKEIVESGRLPKCLELTANSVGFIPRRLKNLVRRLIVNRLQQS